VTDVYAVNDIAVHPVDPKIVATVGSDGCLNLWDFASRLRLQGSKRLEGSLSACGFNRDGKILAYAMGYDWSKGFAENKPSYPLKLKLHAVTDRELRKIKP